MKSLNVVSLLLLSFMAQASAATSPQGNVNGYEAGQSALNAALNRSLNQQRGAAKNVILFVGDGMSIATVTAARIYEGQSMGLSGEEHNLAFDDFPFAGLSRTYNTDAQTPDSAGTMTAMVTGVKTRMGVLGVGPEVARDDCAAQAANELMSIATMAELAGKRTGMISTARITHATPAALYAHSVNRDWESDVDFES
jgi:Alkaline phosphatase